MRRGDIFYANLSPSVGSEINKKRPVLIISNNANNRISSNITVIPITSAVNKIYPFEVALHMEGTGLSKSSKVQCQQIRTISKLRITSPAIGKVDKQVLQYVEEALKLHLDFM